MTHSVDEQYMRHCLDLAEKGLGSVSPNPLVGAVLVHQNEIIGEGFHEKFGQAHAEINCLNSVAEQDRSRISSSTLYVSLEPCSHYGKTPPCTNAIIEYGIPKVVIGCRDFSEKVNGQGMALLKQEGIEVVVDVLKEEALWMNRRFFTAQEKKRPYIILKWAQSLDGFMGREGESIWITQEESRKLVHVWRSQEDAIWVGYRTALVDNPKLNVRLVPGRNPLRLVYDRDLSLPNHLHLFQDEESTVLFNLEKEMDDTSVQYRIVKESSWMVDILTELYESGFNSVIIEGGKALLEQVIQMDLWDEARLLTSSHLLKRGIPSPHLKAGLPVFEGYCGTDQVSYFINPHQSLKA